MWQPRLLRAWQDAGVRDHCTELGIDFDAVFTTPLEACIASVDPYADHRWRVMPHSLVPTGVLHCYPIDASRESAIWEEWFLWEDGPRHHVLQRRSPDSPDGTFSGQAGDRDHPAEVLGFSWFFVNDPVHTPRLLLGREDSE